MYIPHRFAIDIQDERLRTAERRRLGQAAAREAGAGDARGARSRRGPWRHGVLALRPRAVAAVR